MSTETPTRRLDPVTFEVLKNSFVNLVDQMSEQMLRTCYSFVIYARDFSNCLCDANGDTVMQGSQDIAVHVGTLHYSAKAVLEAFKGDLHPGDVIAVNDPYLGGTHFCDVRIIRPVFEGDRLVALIQTNGHWADVGGTVPGSFDITATEHYGEGLRIPPVKIWDKGVYRADVANLLVANMRLAEERLGDLRAQAEATRIGEDYLRRLIAKYGVDTVVDAMAECQDYVERLTRAKIRELPKGTWETEDYIDVDPVKGEGLVPVHVKLTIEGDDLVYDLTGSAPAVGCFLNAAYGSAFSAIVAGSKTFFPEIPLNSGFYRVVKAHLPEGTVVNAPWPVAVTGFCSGAYEKIMNATFEMWSKVMPERALACSFNLEYLLVGGWDRRPGYDRPFMWYDWMVGGWGGRNGKDGSSATAPVFGVGLMIQPLEGQERLTPVITTHHEILTDSGGPGKHRGGCGVRKGGILTKNERSVMSYSCDRELSVTFGIEGGLPGYPHGAKLHPGTADERFLGAIFSGVPIKETDVFDRPSSGGGGFGDPLDRDPAEVLEDVIDGYVSIERAKKDYGVVVEEVDAEMLDYRLDEKATAAARKHIRANRATWLREDPEAIAAKDRSGELDLLDTIRQYGVIVNQRDGQLLPNTTRQFREMLDRRTVAHWN
ncbi:MAG: hydantoinase B/oxoprolinase family protein [Chloroflexota bacterium]